MRRRGSARQKKGLAESEALVRTDAKFRPFALGLPTGVGIPSLVDWSAENDDPDHFLPGMIQSYSWLQVSFCLLIQIIVGQFGLD